MHFAFRIYAARCSVFVSLLVGRDFNSFYVIDVPRPRTVLGAYKSASYLLEYDSE